MVAQVQEYWSYVVAVGTPSAAVVVFVSQVLGVRKQRLEIEKLQNDLREKESKEKETKRPEGAVRIATPEEIARFGRTASFSSPAFVAKMTFCLALFVSGPLVFIADAHERQVAATLAASQRDKEERELAVAAAAASEAATRLASRKDDSPILGKIKPSLEQCADETFFARAVCMDSMCKEPEFRTSPECEVHLAKRSSAANGPAKP